MSSLRKAFVFPLFSGVVMLACSLLPSGVSQADMVAVSSSDGVASVTYSRGAVDGDPDVQIAPAEVPSELVGLSGQLLAYDLQPSGIQFDQPATIRFELDEDIEPEAVPLGLIVVQDDSGQAEALETHVSREGSKVVVSADLPHFSRTYVWLATRAGEAYFRIDPTVLVVEVGQSKEIGLVTRFAGEDQTLAPYNKEEEAGYDYRYQASVAQAGDGFISILDKTSVHCDRETKGVIKEAFDVDLLVSDSKTWSRGNTAHDYAVLTTGLNIRTGYLKLTATMSGHVECIDSGPLPTPTDQRPSHAETLETPPVVTGFELNVEEQSTASCDFKPPSGGGSAILHGSDDGFVLTINMPFGVSIKGDGNGGLASTYAPGPAGFGETGPRQLAVNSLERAGETLTLQVEETRFTDGFPDGCSRPYQIDYRFEDGAALDFLEQVPSGGSQGTKVESPNLMKGDGSFALEGQFVNMGPGQVYYAWTQVSAADDYYYLNPIAPASDGTFNVTVILDVSEGDWTIIEVLVDGVPVASTAGPW